MDKLFLHEIFDWYSDQDHLFIDGASTLAINHHRFRRAISISRYSEDQKVLDIGSYPGFGVYYFKNYLSSGLIPEEYAEKLSRIGIKNIPVNLEKEMLNIPNDVELILFQEVIEHLRNPHIVLRKITESMPVGSKLYLTTNNIFYYGYILKLIFGKPILDPIETEDSIYPGHQRYYSLSELVECLGKLGLKVVHEENVNMLPPIKFYRKKYLGIVKKLLSIILPRKYATHIEILAMKT